ncbi:auxin-responsive protein SAUR68-like [Malus domestica]|uniref:auxin-responsive protein SAUR68-like n=1 Tax=Malus domestica TaxID=3750 RepID=UPI000498C19D|nr:auxin-responsive protein SAUR68-like [Malus domestica]
MDMIVTSPKRLMKMARKLQKTADMGRKKISNPRVVGNNSNNTDCNSMGEKGTFVIYTVDKKRYVLPLSYLHNCIFQKLFKLSEEEFGLSSSRPIIVPCDSLFMNYIVSLFQRGITTDLEKAVLINSTISSSCFIGSTNLYKGKTGQQLRVLSGY